jgi:hypothetical protein
MNTREFLSMVWPPSGPYCIATPWIKPDGEKTYAHHGCDTLDEAIAYVLSKKQSKDLYFATHAIKVVRGELNPKTGKYQTSRKKPNMREARIFFFDIDVGPHTDPKKPKPYPTRDEALGALEQFLFETCLPSPFVVSSGYGIHVYWMIETPIESETWYEPAARLFWLSQQHKLRVDRSKTTDQTTVLRVVGTFNYKDRANPRPVAVLADGAVTPTAEFVSQLEALTENYTPDTNGKATHTNGSGSEPGLNVAWDGRRPPADEVADVCEHMRTFRDTQGNVSEPLWHVGIGTIKHCDDGEEKAHEWSSGYPKYTEAETQAKLDNWTTPPPGCEKIDRNSGDAVVCARCPHRDLAKNPLLIANLVYQQTHQPQPGPTTTDPTPLCLPPSPYKLDMTYGVTEKKKGVICDCPMFPIQWVEATSNESCLSRWYVKSPRNGWRVVELMNDDLNLQGLGAALRNKGIIIQPKHFKAMHAFLPGYLRELRNHVDDLEQFDHLGWKVPKQEKTIEIETPVEFGTPEWFILYGRKIRVADGMMVPCVMTQNTQLDCMGRMGTLKQQTALMSFYNDPAYMAQQFAIGASLATPFFRFSGLHGMLICLFGETGASKSTGLYTAASIWGHPELYPISGLRSTGTDKGRFEYSMLHRNLPFMCDEVTRFDKETAHEIALAATQPGTWKGLRSDRSFRNPRGGRKSNLFIFTSNKSLIQMVNSDSSGGQAGIMRVFEITVAPNTVHTKTEADTFKRLLVTNYGWIGEDFLRRCLPHTEAIGKKLLEILQRFEAAINAKQEERYMTAAAATALLGIKLGNMLGYWQFSYKAMWDWLVNVQIPAMRAVAKDEREHMSPETILNDYLEKTNPNMCRVNRNTRGEIEILHAPPMVEFKARYEVHKAEVYVRIGPFRDYCNEHNHDYSNILNQLTAIGSISNRSIKKRMRSESGNYSSLLACFVIPVKTTSPIAVPNAPDDESRKIVDFKPKP